MVGGDGDDGVLLVGRLLEVEVEGGTGVLPTERHRWRRCRWGSRILGLNVILVFLGREWTTKYFIRESSPLRHGDDVVFWAVGHLNKTLFS